MEAYTPGEQPRDKKYIKLNTNESPYPASPKAVEAINGDEVKDLRLYPDPTCSELREAIAKRYGVNKENVFVSNGSDDILNFFFLGFCDEEKTAVFPDITYGFYPVYCNLYGLKYREIPLRDDFSVGVEDYLDVKANVVIANPNAPTGKTISLDDIRRILESNRDYVCLIDEAYVDFGTESAATLVKEYDNLLVVQTFSKSRSLAGGRLGFAIASSEIIEGLEKIKYSTNPYSINRLTLLAGKAAIEDEEYFEECRQKIIETREYTTIELEKRGFTVIPSKANFVFAKLNSLDGGSLYLKLKEKGILVRHFKKERIKDYLRITIGKREEMERLIDVIDELAQEPMLLGEENI